MRLTHRILLLFTVLVLALAMGGCSDGSGIKGTVVVGLTSELNGGDEIHTLQIDMLVDGESITSDSFGLGGPSPELTFPAELKFTDVEDGSKLEITIQGYDDSDALRVVRHMETRARGGETVLHRLNLEATCMLKEEAPGDPVPSAPTCNETTQTCIAGACRDAFVHPNELEAYQKDWATSFEDICKKFEGGVPEVIVGRGQ